VIRLDLPLVVGHRGFPSRAVENTMPSFEAALDAGASGIECDVRLTKDGAAAVFHDDSLNRLLGLEGAIERLPADVLPTLTFVGASAGIRIPLLEDVLAFVAERDALALVELKADESTALDLARAALGAVERTSTRGRVAFLSFSHGAVAAIRELAPAMPVGPIFERTPPLDAVTFHRTGWAVFEARAATRELTRALAEAGVRAACYGVDDEAIDAELDAAGVGLRISDHTDRLVARRAR